MYCITTDIEYKCLTRGQKKALLIEARKHQRLINEIANGLASFSGYESRPARGASERVVNQMRRCYAFDEENDFKY